MKTSLHLRSLLFAVMFTAMYSSILNAQMGPLWDKNQQTLNIFENMNYNNIGIGILTPLEKLHVKGNLKVEGKIIADSMRITRILSTNDSVIHFGDHSITINYGGNVISWSPTKSGCGFLVGYNGLAIANGTSFAKGNNSMVFGNNVNVPCGVPNAFAMGNGLTNSISNSFQLGWSTPTIFADATGVGINNLTSHTQALDVNGNARIRSITAGTNDFLVTAENAASGTLHKINFTGSSTDVLLGNGTFGPAPSGTGNPWVLGGNLLATNADKLGATGLLVNLNIYAGGNLYQFIDGTTGFIGIGNGFSTPASRLHQHEPTATFNYHQWTNAITGNTFNHGLRIGIAANTIAEIRQEEDKPIDIFTKNVLAPPFPTRRIRITHDGTANNNTRVGIGSVSNGTPLTYLHVGNGSSGGNGYRNWMNVGTLYDQGVADNMYVGLREYPPTPPFTQSDKHDAIINWGNNPVDPNNPNNTDHLRFVFTTFLGSAGSMPKSASADGMEVGRMTAQYNPTGNLELGRTGIGDFLTPVPPLSGEPQNALEIRANTNAAGQIIDPTPSGLRFSYLTSASPTVPNVGNMGVLAVNASGDVIYVPGGTGGGTFGVQCPSANPTVDGLQFNTDVPLNNKNFIFSNTATPTAGSNLVGIGNIGCNPTAKLDVLNTTEAITGKFSSNTVNTTSVLNVNSDGADISTTLINGTPIPTAVGQTAIFASSVDHTTAKAGLGAYMQGGSIGIIGVGTGGGTTSINTVGIAGLAQNSTDDQWGVQGTAIGNNSIANPGLMNFGVSGGAQSTAPGISQRNTGVSGDASGLSQQGNFGGAFTASGSNNGNIGVSAYAPSGAGNWAGSFNGDVFCTANATFPTWSSMSDSLLKENVSPFISGLNIIRSMHPKSYNYNGKANLDTSRTYFGVIAEDLKQIAPYAVDSFFAKLDSTDTEPTKLLSVRNDAIIYTSINAIKQLDSAVTKATAVPNAPVLISPADGAVGSFNGGGALAGNQIQPTTQSALTWHSVSAGVVLYHAQIAKDNAFSNLVFDNSGITDTTANFSVCDSVSTTYYWRVNAKNNSGTGAWSALFSFTDTAVCVSRGGILPIAGATATGFNSESDSRLKTNIAPITNALDKVNALSGIYYDWTHSNPHYVFDSTRQIGFIAQDMQQVVPQVVHTDVNGFLTLDYGRMAPVLVEAIKALVKKDSVQQAQIDALQSTINSCCNISSRTNNNDLPSTDVDLASKSSILWQNFPNPFGDGTVIRYFVAESSASASIVFYDEFGNEIKNMELPFKGQKAELNISTMNLSSGIYSYSLIVNGKIMDTKRMVKTK